MNKLIVIPARGGSKGIPKKNIYPILGKPLLEYTLDMLEKAELSDTDIVVSTDALDIKQVALKYKQVLVIDRPEELGKDNTSTEDVLLHVLDYMEKAKYKKYDSVLTIQPTSPLRKASTLVEFIKCYEMQRDVYDAMISLSETRSDFWIQEDGRYMRLFPNAPRRRQERQPLYVENSAYYITSADALRNTHSVLGTKVGGFLVPEAEGIDINEPIDLKIAETFLANNGQ